MNRREALKKTGLLGGAALLSTALITLLDSCQTQERLTWEPQFLNIDQAQLITALVDTILPKTDTPGALDVKVDIFLDLVFAKMYDQQAQQQLVKEMDQFSQTCQKKFGKDFYRLDAKQRTAILEAEEANAPKFARKVWGRPVEKQEPVGFYRSIKSMAIWAYCTSEEVGKNVLQYDPIPGDYQGCIPFAEVGKVWSL
ncbi:MAG: gluconate 2-dehydrogenase subunit 3 family protein [Bacteroidota bacterium]